jgi:TolB-like protein/Tfp pilus assembly protein PilF
MLTSSLQDQGFPSSAEWSSERLDSWKEIAVFFRREVRTVQMWEKKEGLPIRRQRHTRLGSVFAFRRELEQWWVGRSSVSLNANPKYVTQAEERAEPALGTRPPVAVTCVGEPILSRRILSLPFELVQPQSEKMSVRQSVASFSEGLRAELNVELGRMKLHPIDLPARALPSPGTTSASFLRTMTRTFEVEFLLCGTVSYTGDRVRIIIQLVLGADSSCVWSERFECDLQSTQSQVLVAARIARGVAAHILRDNQEALENGCGESRLALNAYGMGLYFWNQRSRKTLYKSIGYLEDAVELDPEYAAAYATLADAYVSLSYHHLASPAQAGIKAYEAVRKAIQLEPDSLQVRNAYINVLLNSQLNRAAAERECRALFAAGISDARTLQLFSIVLGAIGQHREAVSQALEAQRIAPESHNAAVQLGQAYFYAQAHESARDCLLEGVQMKPQSMMNHAMLGRIEAMLGNWAGALAAFEHTAVLSDNSLLSRALLAYAHAGTGDICKARRELEALEECKQDACYPAYEIAGAHTRLNQTDQAIENLVRARDLGDMKTIFIGQDPSLLKLRSLTAFQRISAYHRAN